MTRDEIELAVFGDVQPRMPVGSWRAEVIDLMVKLDGLGALTENDIQDMRLQHKRKQEPNDNTAEP